MDALVNSPNYQGPTDLNVSRLCPMLNGTIKQPDGFGDSAFGSQPTPSQQVASSPANGFS